MSGTELNMMLDSEKMPEEQRESVQVMTLVRLVVAASEGYS